MNAPLKTTFSKPFNLRSGAISLSMLSFCLIANSGFAQTPSSASISNLLSKANAAHGGTALAQMKTYQEEFELYGMVLGIRDAAKVCKVTVDVSGKRARFEFREQGKLSGIFQQTPQGVTVWTPKGGNQTAVSSEPFTPSIKAGILGMLSIGKGSSALRFTEKDQIGRAKGESITVDTPGENLSLILAGKTGASGEKCTTSRTYLFLPDGTLAAERTRQTTSKRKLQMEFVFSKYQTFEGVKVPTEMSVKNSEVPGFVTLRLRVKKITINSALSDEDFKLP